MSACTFFGHRDCPIAIAPLLHKTLIELIEKHGVNTFYVGRQGAFDSIVHSVLRELRLIYPNISYSIVLERIPIKPKEFDIYYFSNTILPEGIEAIPPRYAINWRNSWMLKQSDYVISYISHNYGGAAKFVKMAEQQKKIVINLAK